MSDLYPDRKVYMPSRAVLSILKWQRAMWATRLREGLCRPFGQVYMQLKATNRDASVPEQVIGCLDDSQHCTLLHSSYKLASTPSSINPHDSKLLIGQTVIYL